MAEVELVLPGGYYFIVTIPEEISGLPECIKVQCPPESDNDNVWVYQFESMEKRDY